MNSEYFKAIAKGLQEMQEGKKKLDPVDDSELKGKHKDREDKDIDNDGDTDKSDVYLHKKRKAIKSKMDDEENVQEESCDDDYEDDGDDKKKKMKKEYKKMKKESYVTHPEYGQGEVVQVHEDDNTLDVLFDDGLWNVSKEELQVESKQTKGATPPEGIMDKESPKSKKFAKDHEGGVADDASKGIELVAKAGKATKSAPARNGDQLSNGDKKIKN